MFKERRKKLIDQIKKTVPDKKGSVFLWANGVIGSQLFDQEASFYYFTGINEPSLVLQLDFDGKTRLFIPDTQTRRARWLSDTCDTSTKTAIRLGVDEIIYFGESVAGYQLPPLFSEPEVKNLINIMQQKIAAGDVIFTCAPTHGFGYVQQQLFLLRLAQFVPQLFNFLCDISVEIARLRRKKDKHEVEKIFHAVQATIAAQYEVMGALGDGVEEKMVHAHIAATFAALGMQSAFAPIVAAGKNSVFPHYEGKQGILKTGDLVTVDCGAQHEHYCADLTRTYPVSGTFSSRQQEIYSIVLECQELLESLAKPGMYLNNKEKSELSLYHQALAFFEKRGYGEYMVHGIGHFVGLDVHDVGNAHDPLQEGDVIALEPALYLPKDGFGIRIEDNYWITPDGAHCLSQELAKKSVDVQEILQSREQHACGDGCDHHHHD